MSSILTRAATLQSEGGLGGAIANVPCHARRANLAACKGRCSIERTTRGRRANPFRLAADGPVARLSNG